MSDNHQKPYLNIRKEALEAEKRIRNFIRETPLEYSSYLSQIGDCRVFLKLENLQITGSFKLRGAANKLLSLSFHERKIGVVTASSGNHGSAFAYFLNLLGIKGEIYIPDYTSKAKIENLYSYNADVKIHGNDCVKSENYARKMAKENNRIYISPYNDPQIIGGQATAGVELDKQLDEIDAVFVPVGGGGLISGVAGYLKSGARSVEIIGCQPENSSVMFDSIRAGKIIDKESKPTLSDGTAGGIEKGAITLALCQEYVDDFVLVSEQEIKESIILFTEKHFMLIEGAAALSVASFLKIKKKYKGKNVVLVISGSKISLDTLRKILCE